MRSTHRLPLLLSAGIAGLLLTAMPLRFDGSTIGSVPAWAGNAYGHDKDHGNGNANDKENHGSTASKLGALNAAHASDTALANASPNSRVGKIAAYKEAELAAKAAAEAAAEAEAVNAAGRDAFDAADLNDDGVLDDTETAAMTAEQQAAIEAADTNADGVIDDSDVADVQAAADAAQDEADAALVNAANKDITDDEGNVFSDVRDAVNDLLGID